MKYTVKMFRLNDEQEEKDDHQSLFSSTRKLHVVFEGV